MAILMMIKEESTEESSVKEMVFEKMQNSKKNI